MSTPNEADFARTLQHQDDQLAAAADDGALFAEPAAVPLPIDVSDWAFTPEHRVGWQLLGDDGETLLIRGHDWTVEEITEVLTLAADLLGAPQSWDEHGPGQRIWARRVTSCPEHPGAPLSSGCAMCGATEAEPVWDWSGDREPGRPDPNRYSPGYVPVLLIHLEV